MLGWQHTSPMMLLGLGTNDNGRWTRTGILTRSHQTVYDNQAGSTPAATTIVMSASKGGSGGPANIVVHPEACCIMALHASQHRHEAVRGFLVGTSTDAGAVQIRWAVPVAHGPVTVPLVELALGMCEAMPLLGDADGGNKVVGWYTAPRLLKADEAEEAGPVDVRVASGLNGGGVLLVMRNDALGSVLKGDDGSVGRLFSAASSAGGPSRAKEVVVVRESVKAGRAAREAISQGVAVEDFVDHLECSSAAESTWLRYDAVADLIKKC